MVIRLVGSEFESRTAHTPIGDIARGLNADARGSEEESASRAASSGTSAVHAVADVYAIPKSSLVAAWLGSRASRATGGSRRLSWVGTWSSREVKSYRARRLAVFVV
jgi:hypothetical protein